MVTPVALHYKDRRLKSSSNHSTLTATYEEIVQRANLLEKVCGKPFQDG